MTQLRGKTALVTGGTTGIGLAAAQRLAAEGAHVLLTGRNQPGVDAAAASKAAIRSFGRTWAAELVGHDIRVNTLVPGPVETPGLVGLAPYGEEQKLLADMAFTVPMGRVGRPDEIASAVVFLASDQSSFHDCRRTLHRWRRSPDLNPFTVADEGRTLEMPRTPYLRCRS
jgi:NAD(P)-dependent dehydrogenase (short-subunit alcohol dehydrogenase family)